MIIGTDAGWGGGEGVENERMLALIDVELTQQVTAVIADVAYLQREVVGDGVLNVEVVIHEVGGAEVRIHAQDAARCDASAIDPGALRKNNAIPVERGARDIGLAEIDRAA